ncbi:MAG: alpha/beta fold hydrolase [Flavobacteriaceae bacterium]
MIKTASNSALQTLHLSNGQELSFQHFGCDYLSAPVVVINHPLTANSTVTDSGGWWNEIVGKGKVIDTEHYAVIAFNVPGNGFDGKFIEDYRYWHTGTVAGFFCAGLRQLGIQKIHALIGGSIGAGIAWEMVVLCPSYFERLVPIGGDWKSSDWMIATTYIQKHILDSSPKAVEVARMHAMMCYRTPKSYKLRFNRTFNKEQGVFNVESWLSYHGDKLKERFQLQAYKTMNHLLGSIDITRNGKSFEENIKGIQSQIHIISIDSDLFFPLSEDLETVDLAKKAGIEIAHHIITSDYGHDAFLMEADKLRPLLNKILN